MTMVFPLKLKMFSQVIIGFLVITLGIKFLASPAISACNPPSDYSTCPAETQPDMNLLIRGWIPTTGSHNLFVYQHPTNTAPELNTLIDGNGNPSITSLYKVKPMPWDPPNFLDNPPGLSEFATLVGFATNVEQNILVPKYAYTIDGINQVTILYATNTQATLNYTTDDGVGGGYIIHLLNFNVDPKLVECYNKYNSQGRKELPVLAAGEIVGKASGNEVLVSIRDRGTFSDPRWENDWWLSKAPATGLPFTCKSLAVGINPGDKGQPYSPGRLIDGSGDTVESESDTVLLHQEGDLSYPQTSRVVTRGGFFEQFQDISMPFAEELTKFLAGPYVRDVGPNSNLKIRNFQKYGRIAEARPLVDFTPQEEQDELRHIYRWKCGNGPGDPNGYYCSKRTIGQVPDCQGPNSNECLFSDGTEIADGPRKPHPKDAVFQTNGKFDFQKYQKALDIWNSSANAKNKAKWQEIPLFSNPKTKVDKAIFMNACPYPSNTNRGETTVMSKTLWVSALKDVSEYLNRLMVPSGANQTTLNSSPNSKLPNQTNSNALLASKNIMASNSNKAGSPILLTQGYDCNSPYSISIENVNFNGSQINYGARFILNPGDGCQGHLYINERFLGIPICPPDAYFQSGDPNSGLPPIPASANGDYTITVTSAIDTHKPCGFVHVAQSCSVKISSGIVTVSSCSSVIPPQPTPTCAPPVAPDYRPDGNSQSVEVEGHALMREPHANLSGRWDSPTQCIGNCSETYNDPTWAVVKYPFLNTIYENLSGKNGIFMLNSPSSQETEKWDEAGESKITYCFAKHGASSMVDGKLLIDQVPFNKPYARCEDNTYTRGLSVYPKYIGGVKNAQEWYAYCVLKPFSKDSRCQVTESCPTLDYNLPFRTTSDDLSNINSLINDVKKSFPKSTIDKDITKVIDRAKRAGWSPAFVVSLWIEETGASHTVETGQSNDALGCRPTVKKTLDQSLDCLFNNFSQFNNNQFKQFMLNYSGDILTGCFKTNPNFPGNILRIYNYVKSF